ncbi:MAG TPA: hypothetical protein VII52_11920, partial [Gemmatimonadaceae bacterium]
GADVSGRNWYVGADGEPSGGPMGAALVAIDGKPSAGTMSHYNRVEGGWTLNRTTTTVYDASGRPAYTISMDVSDATIAAVSMAQMSFGGAARAVRQVGDALANALLPAVAAAQDGGTPIDTNADSDGSDGSSGAGSGVPKWVGWVEIFGELVGVIITAVGAIMLAPVEFMVVAGVFAIGAAAGFAAAIGAQIVRLIDSYADDSIINCTVYTSGAVACG